MSYGELTTEELWDLVLRGNESAIGELVSRLDLVILAESKIYGQVNEDVAQDVREKLIRAIRKEFPSRPASSSDK